MGRLRKYLIVALAVALWCLLAVLAVGHGTGGGGTGFVGRAREWFFLPVSGVVSGARLQSGGDYLWWATLVCWLVYSMAGWSLVFAGGLVAGRCCRRHAEAKAPARTGGGRRPAKKRRPKRRR